MTGDAITCGKLNTLLPGIAAAYGAEQPVDVFIHLHEIGEFSVAEKNSEMKAQSTFDLQFWVHKTDGTLEYAAGLALEEAKLGFEALTSEMTLTI